MHRFPWLQHAPFAACCLIAACIPLPFIFATLAIWALILSWLLAGNYRETFRRFFSSVPYLLWTALFALFACGYFISENKAESVFDTVGKLSFVLLPLLAGAGAKLSARQLGVVLICFIFSTTATGISCIAQAWHFWKLDGDTRHFFYHELPRGLDANAVYMAWYVVAALSALLLFPWNRAGISWMRWLRWPLLLFCSFFLLLLAARMLMLAYLLLVLPAFGIRYFVQNRKRWVAPIAAVALALGLTVVLARTANPVQRRFAEIMNPDLRVVKTQDFNYQRPELSNLTLRLLVWRVGLDNIRSHNLWLRGSGNGDVHRLQNERFASMRVPDMTGNGQKSQLYNVNLHNMYLQTLFTAGIPGLLLLLSIALYPVFAPRRSASAWLSTAFHIIAIAFMFQESALQTQAGVVFYCFFYAIFYGAVKPIKKEVHADFQKR